MLIGIDARFYGETGPGRYVKNILSQLEKLDKTNKYVVFLRKRNFDSYTPSNPNFSKVMAEYGWYSFQDQLLFLWKLLGFKLDLFYAPHFSVPILYPGKLVTAIPDLIMHKFSTEDGTTLPKLYYKFKKLLYYLVFFVAVIRSKKIIVPSLATKSEFLDYYKFVPESKYVLAYEGVDPMLTEESAVSFDELAKNYGIKGPFLLYISNMYKHKNVDRLIEMFELLRSKYAFSGQLVLIGKKDMFSQRVQNLVKEKGLEDVILMPGMNKFIPDEELVVLRKHAEVYVFPSLMEGFSLTPLEAMAVGLPCAVSDIKCHREIFKDSAVFFDPLNPDYMAQKVSTILKNPELKKSLVAKGYETVGRFSWETAAKITLAVFRSVSAD